MILETRRHTNQDLCASLELSVGTVDTAVHENKDTAKNVQAKQLDV